ADQELDAEGDAARQLGTERLERAPMEPLVGRREIDQIGIVRRDHPDAVLAPRPPERLHLRGLEAPLLPLARRLGEELEHGGAQPGGPLRRSRYAPRRGDVRAELVSVSPHRSVIRAIALRSVLCPFISGTTCPRVRGLRTRST